MYEPNEKRGIVWVVLSLTSPADEKGGRMLVMAVFEQPLRTQLWEGVVEVERKQRTNLTKNLVFFTDPDQALQRALTDHFDLILASAEFSQYDRRKVWYAKQFYRQLGRHRSTTLVIAYGPNLTTIQEEDECRTLKAEVHGFVQNGTRGVARLTGILTAHFAEMTPDEITRHFRNIVIWFTENQRIRYPHAYAH